MVFTGGLSGRLLRRAGVMAAFTVPLVLDGLADFGVIGLA